MLRCFLEDADAKKHTSAMVRNTVKEIKEIVLDAEDIVETFLLKEGLRNTSGIKKRVKRLAWVIVDHRKLASDIRAISTRISKVIRDMQSFGVQQIIVNETYSHPLQEIQREVRRTFSTDSEDHLVGLEKNVEKLVGYLVEKDRSQVVSITGMGGLGKTTLARQVFNHETIKSHFPGLVWVCVSQKFKREYVWQTILRKLRPEYEVSKMTEDELQEKLVRVFETQKALIVIDDIWREGDWDRIKDVFLPRKGWKILFTSRNEGVALHASPRCLTIKPEYLNFEESWNLFQRVAFLRKDTTELKIDEDMELMGKQMIKHCGGLPLAVKVLGGLLAPQYTLREWTRIYENIKSHIVGGTSFNNINISSLYNILYLSFEELPIHLKHCFLYLAHFPEDYQIDVEDLSYYWAAEGIPKPMYYEAASIRDIGDRYIEELVKRNMVISERGIMPSRYKTCQLHDMMREVCLLKSEEENFVQIVDPSTFQLQAVTSTERSQLPCKSRRIFMKSFDDTVRIENPKLRSFLHLGLSWWKAPGLSFIRLQLMRVLDLSGVEFEGGKVSSSIGKLVHLRYLSFFNAMVTHLPSSMQNLKQLLYLNLYVYGKLYMPNIFKEMPELRYLYLPRRLHDKKVKLDLGNLVNLEKLKNLSTKHGSVRDLQGMTKLETLSILFSGGCSVEKLSSCLNELKHLEYLSIIDEGDETKDFFLDCVNLKYLELKIYMPRLPDEQILPSHLTHLKLSMCHLEEDPMPILEKLLHLKEVNLLERSFVGRKMVCSTGGFLQLKKLLLSGLEELEEWIVEEGSMPLLHTLKFSNCKKLKELHNGLIFITSLQIITLHGCVLEEDPMPILEKLLHLTEVELESNSFGRRMACSSGGFPQLKKLLLYGLEELEEWIIEERSMPLLHTLIIDYCKKLKELRDGMGFIPSLERLYVEISGEEWKNIFSEEHLPSCLTTITLRGCHLEEDPVPVLEKLLQLKEVDLGEKSFCGRRMIFSRGGFPKLQKLAFYELEEWEEWIIEEGSMPLLYTLKIFYCKKLKELPDGLRFITSLKDLTFDAMGKKWKKRLSEGGEDYHKIQHILSVEIDGRKLPIIR